jgi:MATE family multidrug resistance protein
MRPAAWRAPLDPREFRHLLALGWPAGVQLAFESGLFSAAAVVMGWLGVVALAAHQIALSCAATTFMFPLGIAQALTVRVGHARGAGRHDLVRSIGFSGIGAGAAIMGGFAVVFIFAGRTLAGLFVDNETVAALAARLLVVAGVFQIFDGTQVTSMGALRGLADVRRPTLITFFGYWVLALPAALGLGLACGFGPVGVWSGLALGLAACAALLLARFAALTAAPRPHGRGRALS